MANTLTDMSKIRKVIKLYSKGNSKLFISTYLSLSRNTVKKYISLFEVSGKTIEEILAKSDSELELLFSQGKEDAVSPKLQVLYDYFPKMERDLKKVGVTTSFMGSVHCAVFRWFQKLTVPPSLPNMEQSGKSSDAYATQMWG